MDVLVMTPDVRLERGVRGWLEALGHRVTRCSGPEALGPVCPASSVGRCPLAGAIDAAIVDIEALAEGRSLPCGWVGHVPTVLVAPVPSRTSALADHARVRVVAKPVHRTELLEAVTLAAAGP